MACKASGLTLNGRGRINRSIEAFGYCILGAQANTRSSILGSTGTARNTQTDFLVLIEDALKSLTVSNGAVKYPTQKNQHKHKHKHQQLRQQQKRIRLIRIM